MYIFSCFSLGQIYTHIYTQILLEKWIWGTFTCQCIFTLLFVRVVWYSWVIWPVLYWIYVGCFLFSGKPYWTWPQISPSRVEVSVSSVTQSCPTLCDPMDYSTSGLPVHHQLPEFTQTHVHWVGNAIQPSHPMSSPSPTSSLFQHQGLFQWVSSKHQMAKVLEFQLQHQSFQWIFRTDLL